MSNTRYIREEEYNALTGKFQRKAILNDIVNTSGRSAGTGSDLTLAQVAPASGYEMYPYYIYLYSPGAATFALTNGSSTISYITFDSAGSKEINPKRGPITKLENSSTFSVIVLSSTSGSTYSCSIISERRPTAQYLQNQ